MNEINDRTTGFSNLLLILIGCVVAIGLFEIGGRLLPHDFGFRSAAMYYRFHPVLGHELNPLAIINKQTACTDIKGIVINSLGMRADQEHPVERETPGELRVAVLGDSFTTGLDVGNREHFSALVSRQLVTGSALNFSTPAYGTIQELYAWKLKAHDFQPDITVLAFLDFNDVEDNSVTLTSRTSWQQEQPYFDTDGQLVPPGNIFWSQLENSSLLLKFHHAATRYSFIYFMAGKLYSQISPLNKNTKPLDQPYWWDKSELLMHAGVYQREPDDIWAQAWADTELAVLRLKQSVENGGGKLVIMIIPDTLAPYKEQFPTIYADQVGGEIPDNLDFEYPIRRLTNFANLNDISVLDLHDNFQRYAEMHSLKAPYFYYRCDGHWSPVGHYLAAHSFLNWLVENKLISEHALQKPQLYREAAFLQPSPRELLGADAAKAIFGWGKTYRGDSQVGVE